jgi:hypothetical protein
MGISQCPEGEPSVANGTVAPKQAHMEVDIQQDHQAIVARACRKMNRLMLPFALLFRSAILHTQQSMRVGRSTGRSCPGSGHKEAIA